ncbi:MAG: hypothetical protein J5626_04105 [Lachnospiraceae bacterium]|nr:hypothetical protein [Lachnospiraceae bacterium]
MKKFFGKIWGGIKKPFAFIKRKSEPAREFMKEGRPGGMIAEMLAATLMCGWLPGSYVYHKIPWGLSAVIMAALLVLAAEVINLALKVLFGAGKRCKSYFVVATFGVTFMNLVGNQLSDVGPAVLMSFLLVLSADIIGRCLWAFKKTHRGKQVFAYVGLGLSVGYVAFYLFFFYSDSFGKSRIDFYNAIDSNRAAQVSEFDAYLQNGPYKVARLTYGPEAPKDLLTETLDFTVYDSVNDRSGMSKLTDLFLDYDFSKVPVAGIVWFPEGQKNCPVFFMVHGNHDSTEPSYLGYNYLGEYLASNGYVVISVDENIINATGEGNDKRAILLLENMKTILAENKIINSPLYGSMDEDRLVIGGHSRGGEMVATAYLFNGLESYPEDGNIKFDYDFNITSIVAISPVVDQYMPVNLAVEIEDVNYLLIHGANDHDVSSMMGEKQFNNVSFTGKENDFYLKSSVYILGANHGQFNSEWGRYDMEETTNNFLNTNFFLDEKDQKLIAKAYIRAFLDTTLRIDDTYASLLKDVSPYESYIPDTVYVTNYSDSDFVSLCSFDNTVNISEYGDTHVDCTGTSTWTIDTYRRGSGEGEDKVLSLEWEEESEPAVEVTFPAADVSKGCISFGLADLREDTEDLEEGLWFNVELTDASGRTIGIDNPTFVHHSLAVQLYKQDALFGSYEYKHQLQTVMIKPEMFGNVSFDFEHVTGLKISFDGKEAGSLYVNNIGYWSK